ncbi:MAG: MinD/ParA family protein [Pseudohongiellaceae bacterium]|nr:MinD/ParA family protein [Pseudohongiellaceae bacterium]
MSSKDSNKSTSKVIAITSGKGGVGKTNVSVNLAIALARKGNKVCVFDADTSLANVNILLDIRPQYTLEHLLNGEQPLEKILLEGPQGIRVVPAASGITEFAQLDAKQQGIILATLAKLEQEFDYLIVDTAAGISSNVIQFIQAAQQCIVVVTPEPTSLTDAFALLKVLYQNKSSTPVHVLTNMVDDYSNSVDIYKRLSSAAMRYLHLQTHYFGYIPRDDSLRLAVQKQSPVCVAYPSSPASQRFTSLASSIDSLFGVQAATTSFSLFWRKLIGRPSKAPQSIRSPIGTISKTSKPTKIKSKLSKAMIVKLQKGFVHLIQSRSLSPNSMQSLLSSLLRQVRSHYPEITLDELDDGTKSRDELEPKKVAYDTTKRSH